MKKSFFKVLTAVFLCIVVVMCATACSETPLEQSIDPESGIFGGQFSSTVEKNNLAFYLSIDNIEGESTDRKHDKWIEITDFSHGSVQSVETDNPDKVEKGKFIPVKFTHKIDKATPKIQQACANGSPIRKAELNVTASIAGKQETIYKVVFETVRIVRAEVKTITDEYGNPSVVEEVSMIVNRETWTITAIGLDNTIGGNTEATYDQSKKC